MHATLSVTKNRHVIEVTIPFGGAFLRAEEATDDMYTSIDAVVDKMERQIRKQKTKLERRNYSDSLKYAVIPDINDEEREKEAKIVKTKRFAIKPMSAEEAVLQMELIGHNFFVFQDADSSVVNVVYKRKDGDYGLIEPEF
jgi:putative sigma-54 modulation protein